MSSYPITQVTLFLNGAQIQRTLRTAVKAGDQILTLEALSPRIDPSSLRVNILTPGIKLHSAQLETLHRWEFQEQAHRHLWQEALDTCTRLLVIQDQRRIGDLEEAHLADLQTYLSGSLNSILLQQSAAPSRLKESLDFLAQRRRALITRRAQLDLQSRDTEDLLNNLESQLQQISQADQKEENQILLSLNSPTAQDLEAQITYRVDQAHWEPLYDAYLDDQTLTLELLASIRQSTGETWEDAPLTLSTAPVHLDPQIPPVRPRLITTVEVPRTKTITLAEKAVDGLAAPVPEAEPSPDDEQPSSSPMPQLATALEVPGRPRIPSDGLAHRIPLAQETPKAEITYEGTPQVTPYIYLKAVFPNPRPHPLLSGQIKLHRQGAFLGRDTLKSTPPGGLVTLSFGSDEDLRVLSSEIHRQYKEPGLLGRHSLQVQHRIQVTSFKTVPWTLQIRQSIPVSELQEIEVKFTSPGAQISPEGIALWTLTLNPGSPPAEILTTLEITAPKSFDITALV